MIVFAMEFRQLLSSFIYLTHENEIYKYNILIVYIYINICICDTHFGVRMFNVAGPYTYTFCEPLFLVQWEIL